MYFPDLIGVSSVLFLLRFHCSSSVSNAPALLNPERLNAGSPGCTVQPSFFNVNLDEDPYYRWDHVIAAYPNLREESLELIKSAIRKKGIPVEALPALFGMAALIHGRMSEPYRSELQGIADRAQMNVGEATLTNLAYDFTAFCTSILATDKAGKIWHGRNLDYYGAAVLKEKTIQINFQRNGTTQYTGVSFVGYVGLLTGIRPNAFSVSINERDTGSLVENLLELLDPKVSWLSFDIRQLLDTTSTYSDAVHLVAKLHTPAPVYVILGGLHNNEGAVLTRGRWSTIDAWILNNSHERWYVVQTNSDHWKDVPSWDKRRRAGEKAMNSTGKNSISESTMFDVMSTERVFNSATIYTTVMSASYGSIKTWVRCRGPSEPALQAKDAELLTKFAQFFNKSKRV